MEIGWRRASEERGGLRKERGKKEERERKATLSDCYSLRIKEVKDWSEGYYLPFCHNNIQGFALLGQFLVQRPLIAWSSICIPLMFSGCITKHY
jgi:hypothetical protein